MPERQGMLRSWVSQITSRIIRDVCEGRVNLCIALAQTASVCRTPVPLAELGVMALVEGDLAHFTDPG